MSQATNLTHEFHLVRPSPWPFFGSFAVFLLALGGIMYMHHEQIWIFVAGLVLVLFTMFVWWKDVIYEARVDRAHTQKVRVGLRYGMALFIASEVMFFVGFFWAFFHHGLFLSPSTTAWPPEGITTLDAWGLPLINTIILISSGVTLMVARRGLYNNNRTMLLGGLALSIILGFLFLGLQIIEYGEATFAFTDGVYPSTFYMATGFHGFHVLVGAIFLLVCFFRAYAGHFTPEQHVGFEAAEWYWHFVDIVWIFLFIWVYVWGS